MGRLRTPAAVMLCASFFAIQGLLILRIAGHYQAGDLALYFLSLFFSLLLLVTAGWLAFG
jgi:hypothetical protein